MASWQDIRKVGGGGGAAGRDEEGQELKRKKEENPNFLLRMKEQIKS